ncbi:MAG TPA: FMN-binding negative transcriptional regulator [Prolixibacteraceae bacterium]|nr:FMN-binding negative transcriptional regulator [Prolixibacteraceae bacterium]
MYQPDKYKKNNPAYIFSFIRSHPFATVIINGSRLLATHIPVLTEGDAQNFRLFSHIANHNEMLPYLKDNTEMLLVFQGAHGYVSSSWYQEKDISTWDYSAVHVNARVKIQSKEELKESLKKLVAHFEQNQEVPVFFNDIPQKIVDEHLPQITGFWCEPTKIESIAKFHQGFGCEDVNSVTQHLEKENPTLSREIRKEHGKNN